MLRGITAAKINMLSRIFYCFSDKITRPRDPTVSGTFQTKMSKDQVEILLDPKGFMTEQDKKEAQKQPKISLDRTGKPMEPQYGFKPKGPQPTRYGDWQIKGKCVDF